MKTDVSLDVTSKQRAGGTGAGSCMAGQRDFLRFWG